MTDFAIEPLGNGDWDLVLAPLDDGTLDLVLLGADEMTWIDEVAQRVVYELGMWLGESAWDRAAGFPYLEGVFGRKPIEGIGALITERIIEVEGVDGLYEQPILEVDAQTRRLFVSVQIKVGTYVVPISATIQAPKAAA